MNTINFTDRQLLYLNYLLDQLNFEKLDVFDDNNFTAKYIGSLIKTYNSFKIIGSCEPIVVLYNNKEKTIPKDAFPDFKYLFNGLIYEIDSFSIFNYLKLEINIKQKKKYHIRNDINLSFISATDISNFTFCPVNYSISKTLYYRSLESTINGAKKHEESLINKIVNKNNIQFIPQETYGRINKDIELDENYIQLKKILCDFEVIYSGHLQDSVNKVFRSAKGKFIGQPDFILKNKKTNETVVLEEKYQFIPKEFFSFGSDEYYNRLEEEIDEKRNKKHFYQNHINQVSSYLYGISDFKIDYGILVYWKYEIHDNYQIISKCFFTKIDKNEDNRTKLNKIYKDILDLNTIKVLKFDTNKRSPSKCASCVNNYLCAHKTGKFDKLTIPYDLDYLKISKDVPFPEDLKKNENEIDKRPYIEKILGNISNKE